MAISGSQDFWVAGARVFIQRDLGDGSTQPWLDFGVITEIAANFETEEAQLFDTDGGTRREVARATTQQTESYGLTTANFNNDNLSLLYNSDEVEAFTQSATPVTEGLSECVAGRIFEIKDDASTPVPVYNITSIQKIRFMWDVKGGVNHASTGEFHVKGDQTLTFAAAVTFSTEDDTTGTDPGVFTVTSSSYASATDLTTIIVDEDTTGWAFDGNLFSCAAASTMVLDTDYKVFDLERGLLQVLITGYMKGGYSDVEIDYTPVALSGLRLINPQTTGGTINANLKLYIGREGNERQHVRECNCSITPDATNLTAEDFSTFSANFTVLNDTTDATSPAGRLLLFKGAVPPLA